MRKIETLIVILVGDDERFVMKVESEVARGPSDHRPEDDERAQEVYFLDILTKHELRVGVPDEILFELV